MGNKTGIGALRRRNTRGQRLALPRKEKGNGFLESSKTTRSERPSLPNVSEGRIPVGVMPAEVFAHFSQDTFDALMQAVPRSREVLAQWRSNRGRFGYAYLNILRKATDDAVSFVFLERSDEAELIEQELEFMYREIEEGHLPSHLVEHLPYPDSALLDKWFMDNRVRPSYMREIFEIRLVRLLWPVVRHGKPVSKIPSPANIEVSLEEWFRAISDAISELSKMVNLAEERDNLTLAERINMRENYLGVARALLERRQNDQSEASTIFGSKQWNGTSKWSQSVIRYSEDRLRQLKDLLLIAR